MQFVRKNPLAIAFFILILGPTLLLSFFSFRNILNEGYLAQKNFEEDRLDLKKAIEKAVEDEENEFLQETKAAALFLYEQPTKLLDFSQSTPYKNVQGISSIHLFNGDTLIYPQLPYLFKENENSFSSITVSPLEQEIFNTCNEKFISIMNSIDFRTKENFAYVSSDDKRYRNIKISFESDDQWFGYYYISIHTDRKLNNK